MRTDKRTYPHLRGPLKTTLPLLLFLAAVAGAPHTGAAQAPVTQDHDSAGVWVGTRFNASAAGAGRSLPFWLHANRFGLYDQRSSNGVLWGSFSQPLYEGKALTVHGEGMLAIRTAEQPWAGLQFLSATLDYRFLRLRAGRFPDPIGTNYHPLSSGSMLYGTNARPVPKVALQTDGFVDIPATRGHVQFSAYWSHGWLEESRYTKNAFLHQKYLYLKVNYKMLEGIGGIVHNAQWGGTHPTYGDLPDSFGDYLRMVVGRSAEATSGAPGSEITNSLGNSVAGYDFNLRVNLERFRLTFYRLFYLEDKVSMQFRSPWDGMWGAGYIRRAGGHPALEAMLYEHINTKRQDSYDYEPRGSASYYNHGIYRSGWSYLNRVLGNPLLLTDGSDNRPVYNNIIVAHHLGAGGYLTPALRWRAFYTFSRNYGTWEDQVIEGTRVPCGGKICADLRPLEELKKINHSLYFGVRYTPPASPALRFDFGLAADLGQLYDDRLGLEAGMAYRIFSGD